MELKTKTKKILAEKLRRFSHTAVDIVVENRIMNGGKKQMPEKVKWDQIETAWNDCKSVTTNFWNNQTIE